MPMTEPAYFTACERADVGLPAGGELGAAAAALARSSSRVRRWGS
jgi:hypothetical protein